MERMTPPMEQMHAGLVQIELTPKKPAPKPAWLKAKAPMGETFHNLKKMGARAEPAYRVRERAVPQYRRVLEPEVGDIHDAGKSVHAAVRILRGTQGQAGAD